MNKCLVTTLKAHTNNEALSKYNVLTLKINPYSEGVASRQLLTVKLGGNGNGTINSNDVRFYTNGASGDLLSYPITILPNSIFNKYVENKKGTVEVYNKYNITGLYVSENITIRLRELYGLNGTLETFVVRATDDETIDGTKFINTLNKSLIKEVVISDIMSKEVINPATSPISEFVNLEIINFVLSFLYGKKIGFDDLANNTKLKEIKDPLLSPGKLSSLSKLTSLNRIVFSDSVLNSGDIMDFITPWIAAGRTSGKIEVDWLLGQRNITLNGSPITYPEGVQTSKAYLNWTSDGTVTFTAS